MVQVIYFCVSQIKLRPPNYIISCILQRYDSRQLKKEQRFDPTLGIQNDLNRSYTLEKRQHPTITQQEFVNSIEQDYAEI